MGVLGRRLAVSGAPALRRALTRALADEWYRHYNDWLVARMVRGHRSPDVVRLLVERSERAWARADRLAHRLQELGGRPPLKVGQLLESATDKPSSCPRIFRTRTRCCAPCWTPSARARGPSRSCGAWPRAPATR
jgi:hypothetical protein